MKRSFADILAGLDGERARKVARKLPEWAAAGAEIPSALSLEQCSSSATARYKADLACQLASRATQAATASGNTATLGTLRGGTASEAQRWGPTKEDVSGGSSPLRGAGNTGTILDLTGGLGVDSWAFGRVAERVVSYERDAVLAEAAKRNFARLGADNIEVRCETVTPETELPEADLIYADPARRDAAGRKVFLLEDCTPDILTLLPMMLEKAPAVLLKLSPMADLTMLARRLGPALREIHVVELDGEVKELLCLLQRDASPTEPEITIVLLASRSGQLPPKTSFGPHRCASLAVPPLNMPRVAVFQEAVPADVPQESVLRLRIAEEREAEAVFAAGVQPGDTLLEPCPALLKAGAFNLPCARWSLRKLAPSTHLYLAPAPPGANTPGSAPGNPDFPFPGADSCPDAPGSPWFKAWRVLEVLPIGAAAFRQVKQRWPRAEITARNLPLGSTELQKRMGISPGGDTHIFACRLADGAAVLLVTER